MTYTDNINDDTIQILLEEYFSLREKGTLELNSPIRKLVEEATQEFGGSYATQIIPVSIAILEYPAKKLLQKFIVTDFKTLDNVVSVTLKQEEIDSGVLEHLEETRSMSSNWFVDYFIYSDKVIAIETMENNYHHCKAEAKTMEEILKITSQWC